MHDDLDTFPREGRTRLMVPADDEITSALAAFPTEEVDSPPPNDAVASATYTPAFAQPYPSIAPAAVPRWRRFAPAALVVMFVLGLIAGQAIVKQLMVDPQQGPAEVPSVPTLAARSASAESHSGAIVPQAAEIGRSNEGARTAPPAAKVVNTRTGVRPPLRPTPPAPKTRIDAAASSIRHAVPPRPTVATGRSVSRPVVAAAVPVPPAAPVAAVPAPATVPAPAALPAPVAAAATPLTPPPAAPPAPVTAAAPVVESAPLAQPPETGAVLGTLHRYQEAFSTLDSTAARQVWPGVDVRALDRAFDQLEQQRFNLQTCDVGVAGERAEALCTGTASYTRKVGNKAMRVEERRWRFTLRRDGGEWLIQRVDVR